MRKLICLLAALALPAAALAQGKESTERKAAAEAAGKVAELLQEKEKRKLEEKRRAEELRLQAEKNDWPLKIFQIKGANVLNLQGILQGIFRAEIRADPTLKIMIVRAPKETLHVIEEVINKFDVPPPVVKNIELTAYLLAVAEKADGAGNLPADLQPVVKQLRGVFPYPAFRLLDTLVLRTREGGEAEVSGMAASGVGTPTVYRLNFRSARITSDEKGRIVWLERLRLNARVPIAGQVHPGIPQQFSYTDMLIAADVDIREGQKVVVGKANIEGPDKALFLVVTAKIAD